MWSASQGPMTTSHFVAHPTGLDLMPVVGGWLDIRLGSWLVPWLGLVRAYNTVLGIYVLLAGLGGLALARSLGARSQAAVLAGLLLQLDPFVVRHLDGGRPEQAALGVVALALAGAVACWSHPVSRKVAVGTGLVGALVVFASWELAAMLAVGMVLGLPLIVWGLPRAETGPRRLGLAAISAAGAALPWALAFLSRTLSVRPDTADPMALGLASRASVGWLDFWTAGGLGPGAVAVIGLLAVPFVDKQRRRFWLGVWAILALAFVLGLGPHPSAWPGAPGLPWGPFSALQAIPVLRWFHWPDRIVSVWGIASGAALATTLTWSARRRPRLSGAVGVLALALAVARIVQIGAWPTGDRVLPASPALETVRDDPRPGAVFDLPLRPLGDARYGPQLAQTVHERPIRSIGTVPWLLPSDHVAPPDWSRSIDPSVPVASITFTEADRQQLIDQGYGFIAFQRPRSRYRWAVQAESVLLELLGPPLARDKTLGWTCWALAPTTVAPDAR